MHSARSVCMYVATRAIDSAKYGRVFRKKKGKKVKKLEEMRSESEYRGSKRVTRFGRNHVSPIGATFRSHDINTLYDEPKMNSYRRVKGNSSITMIANRVSINRTGFRRDIFARLISLDFVIAIIAPECVGFV